jgi:hypothetical protein
MRLRIVRILSVSEDREKVHTNARVNNFVNKASVKSD